MGNIIVLGSINMDVVVTAPRHPQLGETIFGDELHFIPGGKGSNQAVAASRLVRDDTVQLIGKLGKDAFGDELRTFLGGENLDLTYLKRSDTAPTGTALITVNSDSENTIVVISGSNMEHTPEEVSAAEVDSETVIVSQFEVPQPAIKTLFQKAQDAGGTTILNPAPAGEFIDGLLDLIDYLIVNETELAYLAKSELTEDMDNLVQSATALRTRDDQVIVVTLGAKGVLCVLADAVVRVEGISIKAVDTTGAGDCFVGALAVALSEGKPIEDALTFANKAASISVQRLGAATSLPHRSEIKD